MFKFSHFTQIFCALKNQKGLSLYLAVVIMAIILAMILGLSAILVGQIKTMGKIGDSVIALYGADTGIERELKENNLSGYSYSGCLDVNGNGCSVTDCPGDLSDQGDACYKIKRTASGIESVGYYRGVKRAIRVTM